MREKWRLWADIPPEERVTEDYVRSCIGADDPMWVQRNLSWLQNPQCEVAVKWGSSGRYHPCKCPPHTGTRCVHHGGPKGRKPPNARTELESPAAKAERLRLQKIATIYRRITTLTHDLEQLQRGEIA